MSEHTETAAAARGRPGALAAIGKTPIIRLSRLVGPTDAEVWVKLEGANPTGSYKDRMALAMIEGAERRGALRPGQPVVEYTGGSTGSALGLVCALKGYPLHVVSSNAFSPEKIRTMETFGAQVELIDSPGGTHPGLVPAMMERAARVAAEKGAFATDQLSNPDAIEGCRDLGREIVEALEGPIHAVCTFVGSGGCLVGMAEAVRARWPDCTRVAIEPDESAVLSGRPAGTHRIEGGGLGFVPPHLADAPYDEVQTVSTDEAFDMARRAAAAEGIWTGPSGGANLVVALRLAARLGPGRRVVTVQPDAGLKYLAGDRGQ